MLDRRRDRGARELAGMTFEVLECPVQRRLDEDLRRCELAADHCRRRRDGLLHAVHAANTACAVAEEAVLNARSAAEKQRGKGG